MTRSPNRRRRRGTVALLFLALAAGTAVADEQRGGSGWSTPLDWNRPPPKPEADVPGGSPWSLALRGVYVHQVQTDTDGGGRFRVNRFAVEANPGYLVEADIPLSLGLGYRFDGFDFGGVGPFGAAPWGDVHTLSAGLPVFLPLGERWSGFGVATVRTSFESGAPLEDGLSFGGIGGAFYRVSESLSIGPGVGVLTEIEDAPGVFPVPLVRWKINPTLTLETGRGLGATLGPGLYLNWTPSACWKFSFGGRFERLRFRMDGRGVAPGGVGQESALSLLGVASFSPRENVDLSLTAGVNLLGTLRIDDARGNGLWEEDYDAAFFAGFGFTFEW